MHSASRTYYKRFYRIAAAAVAVATAVITGSLVLGDSVRGSLVARVNERLGNAETVIQTGTGFLSDTILSSPLLADAQGYLFTEGFISFNGQMTAVNVWGTDGDSLKEGEALVNDELRMMSEKMVLHLPSNNLVGSQSLFVSQNYATQLRLTIKGVKADSDGGSVLLHNEQVRPMNVFVNRRQLAEALGVKGKVNVILSPRHISNDAFRSNWRPELSGITMHDSIVGTDQAFLSKGVVEALQPRARYLAYFVNSLGTIPYSFVTATDQLHGDETVLSDYTAKRLNAQVGDSVTMEYYVSHGGLKQLETRSHRFCISRIVPVSEFQRQATLVSADFPGLSGVRRCTDWDSDLPINMSRITKADEDYWTTYRQTPKALVSLDAVAGDWTGAYGTATKIVAQRQISALSHEALGVAVIQPRDAAMRAAQNGTDFGLLFLALGCFIVIAALLLMQAPLSEMYYLRRSEIQTLDVLGFSKSQTFGYLFCEALPMVLTSSPIGVLSGCGYAAGSLWLLAGPWSGATGTDGFSLHVAVGSLATGFAVSVLLCLAVLCMALWGALGDRKRGREGYEHRLSFWTLALGVLVVFAVGLNRPDSHRSSTAATGGYDYYAESRIPIQYDLNSAAGRRHLNLDDLPADVRFLQLPKHTEDEASCLNLNRVETPSVLAMPVGDMPRFGIDTTLFTICDFQSTDSTSHVSPLKVVVDEEALLWSMMRQVGDTLTYHATDGREVKAVVAGTYPTGVLHGHAVMTTDSYRQLWPDELGSRVLLFNASTPLTAHLSALYDYGLSVTTTADRLERFYEVVDTYLSIFMSLGGLGLLLGLASLLIVIRKNLVARRAELQLYSALGFPTARVVGMLRRQQAVVPLLAIAAGAAGSLLVSLVTRWWGLALPAITDSAWTTALVLLVLIVGFTCLIIIISINPKTIKQCETS